MANELVRFGVAMEKTLLEHFDVIVADRGVTRSELLRDLVRAEDRPLSRWHGERRPWQRSPSSTTTTCAS